MNIVIVMPTFNEGPNIARMIDILTKDVFPKIKHHHLTLLVVDSHSPDGTWKIVQEKSKTNRSVVLLDEGGKYGLGKAYIDGFNLYYGAVKGTQYKWLNFFLFILKVLWS